MYFLFQRETEQQNKKTLSKLDIFNVCQWQTFVFKLKIDCYLE